MSYRKNLTLFIFCCMLNHLNGQINCFEITDILVDAFSGDTSSNQYYADAQNEIVKFVTGPNSLDLSVLEVTFANSLNPWEGVCYDQTIIEKVAYLNSTLTSCGYLKEPINNLIPGNSIVYLISSKLFNEDTNIFSTLSDTSYIIFHCGTSLSGYFPNYGNGFRTFNMRFGTLSACSDTVTYDRSLLINTSGITSIGDGAFVHFTPEGNASYLNYGCNSIFKEFQEPNTYLISYDNVYCNNDGIIFPNIESEFEEGGVFQSNNLSLDINSNDGRINLNESEIGSYLVTYYSTTGYCSNSIFNISPSPQVTFELENTQFCLSTQDIVLEGGQPLYGNYIGPFVTDGVFSTQLAGVGFYNLMYEYTNEFGCTSTIDQNITVEICTSNEIGFENTANIFPNPTNRTLTISLKELKEKKEVDLSIQSLTGLVVINEKVNNTDQPITLDLSKISSGIYILNIQAFGYMKKERIIVQ